MQRYEFLVALHEILRPKTYVETGVQHGTSLRLAVHSALAIGVDPAPLIAASGNQQIHQMTSDEFFTRDATLLPQAIDLGFIDGLHHYDQALRDFFNMQRRSHLDTMIVFDDVLPYTQQVGMRAFQPGDWAGDVYKVIKILPWMQPSLKLTLVNVDPTGVLLVENLNPSYRPTIPLMPSYLEPGNDPTVPDEIINRTHAADPSNILERLRGQYSATTGS